MRRVVLLLTLLSGCAAGPSSDLQYIKQARSIGAEWAAVNEQAGKNKLTEAYVSSMHVWLREQLKTDSKSLSEPNSRYGEEIRALLHQPDDVAPDELRARVAKLKEIEDRLESA